MSNSQFTPPMTSPAPLWLIVGPGKLGIGFFFPLARKLGYRIDFVFSDSSRSSRRIAHYRSLAEHDILGRINIHHSSKHVEEYQYARETTNFHSLSEYTLTDADMASLSVISTSVGINNLSSLTSLLSKLEQAGVRNRTKPILIIVGENGTTLTGLTGSQELKRLIDFHFTSPTTHSATIPLLIPEVMVDCVVPRLPVASAPLHRGAGRLVIENLSQSIQFNAINKETIFSDSIAFDRKMKFFVVNSLHLTIAVMGYTLGMKYVDQVLLNTDIHQIIRGLHQELIQAVDANYEHSCVDEHHINILQQVNDYTQWSLDRMAINKRGMRDNIERFIKNLRVGKYLHDGRLLDPIISLGAHRFPSKAPHLVRCLSLALFHAFRERSSDSEKFLLGDEVEMSSYPADYPRDLFIGRTLFARQDAASFRSLSQAITDDINYLDNIVGGKRDAILSYRSLESYFTRPFRPCCQTAPEINLSDIKLIIFDLDEAIVSTEALLYDCTISIIKDNGGDPAALTHDKYAEWVGIDEEVFFEHIIHNFCLTNVRAADLVADRSNRFVGLLQTHNPERLIKPGLRPLLIMLKKRNINVALISNASEKRVKSTISFLVLQTYFDHRLIRTSDMPCMRSKPDPLMIHDILKMSNTLPSETLVVESSAIGIEAARLAGCYIAVITNEYSMPNAGSINLASYIGNMREFNEWVAARLPVTGAVNNNGEIIFTDMNTRFLLSDPSYVSSCNSLSLHWKDALTQAAEEICSLGIGRKIIIAVQGTVGAQKGHWAKQLSLVLAELNRHSIVIDEDYFLLPRYMRTRGIAPTLSEHESWFDWLSFQSMISLITSKSTGTQFIDAYARQTGDLSQKLQIEWRRDSIILVAGLYTMTTLHKHINYDRYIGFSTCLREGLERERSTEAIRSSQNSETLIRDVYVPLGQRLIAVGRARGRYVDREYDVSDPQHLVTLRDQR